MMRSSRKQDVTGAQELMITEGVYQGQLTAKVLDPFFSYELASSVASLEVILIKKAGTSNQFTARIIVNNCTYFPEKLSYLFPMINIDTTAELIIDEPVNKLTAKGIIPFISCEEKSVTLDFTKEQDGSISTENALLKFSIFANVKKQATAFPLDIPFETSLNPI